MKIKPSDEHNRYLDVTDIPEVSADGTEIPLRTLPIEVRYRGTGGALHGITLDHAVIPQLLAGFDFGALTDRQKCVIYAALNFAQTKTDELNEMFAGAEDPALEDENGDPQFRTNVGGWDGPAFDAEEFMGIIPYFDPSNS